MNAYSYFKEALVILAQVIDSEVSSPTVIVEPSEPIINKAIELLKRMDSNYFSGVRKVVVSTANPAFGFVESGKDKDPTIININMSRMNKDVISTALTIAHEHGHVKSFKEEGGFIGGESPALAEEARVTQWIKTNKDKIQDLL